MHKILIIGGLGYLGGRIADSFLNNGYEVKITTRKSEIPFPVNIHKNLSIAPIHVTNHTENSLRINQLMDS